MLINAKSNLARLMATENLLIEQRNVPTAYFDLEERKLIVPVLDGNLSPELYDLLFGHEVGHALETPAEGWHHSIIDLKVIKSILNVCEDIRIEKKIKRKYPGIRNSFLRGYKELMEKDFFGINDTDISTLNFIDRLNLHSKCGVSLGVEFSEEEMPYVHEAESAETFEHVVSVAQKIQAFMKEQLEKEKDTKFSMKTIVNQDDDVEFGEEVDIEESENTDAETDKNDSKDDSKEEETSSGKDKANSAKGAGGQVTDEMLESKTDNSFREKERQLHDEKTPEPVYSFIPEKIDLDYFVIPFSKLYTTLEKEIKNTSYTYDIPYKKQELLNDFNMFKKESSKVVSYLVKEFELKKNAQQMSRAKVSKTGELDMAKLHNYKFTDDIFRKITSVPNGKSHGLVMYIDWSGSMHNNIDATIKQLINLTLFCRKVNIPFEVYAFSSVNNDELPRELKSNKTNYQEKISGNISISDFRLLNILSSKMNSREYTNACSHLLGFKDSVGGRYNPTKKYSCPRFFGLGGTPLNDAIIVSFDLLPKFKQDNRLEIVNAVYLTDGESNYIDGLWTKTYDKITHKYFPSGANTIIIDRKSKAHVTIQRVRGYTRISQKQTTALLQCLKQRVDMNLIGFFVCSPREVREALNVYADNYDSIDYMVNKFRREDSVTIEKSAGYDEYYLLNSGKLDIEDEEFEAKSTTTRGLVSAFSKYNGKKVSNRVILSRFIEMIA